MGHVFAIAEGAEEAEESSSEDLTLLAAVPRWLTVLVMVAASDAIGTVPLRVAERQARVLGLQVIKAPFLHHRVAVSALTREGGKDAGRDWFLDQIRRAVK
jgi:DNA-binding transcriptional LysR family regulator